MKFWRRHSEWLERVVRPELSERRRSSPRLVSCRDCAAPSEEWLFEGRTRFRLCSDCGLTAVGPTEAHARRINRQETLSCAAEVWAAVLGVPVLGAAALTPPTQH